MHKASRPKGLLARLAACFVVALAVSVAADGVFAQSSVRPPMDARGEFVGGAVPGGTMGDQSQSEMWRAVRQGIEGRVSIPDPRAGILVQSEGDAWRALRTGPLVEWSAYALGGMVALLALFFLLRGRIRIEHGYSGRTVTRFNFVERMAHWLLAVSFILLAITGLNITFGRAVVLPVVGKETFALLTYWGKLAHNYVGFAFIVGVVMILVLWVAHNFPNRHDVMWLLKGGGLLVRGSHPPARKFNAGQKILFWLVILGGLSLGLSGVALMFPFEMALFAKTFEFLNMFGLNLPTELTPIQEMQYAAIWHAMVAVFMVAVVLGHIYIGTLGMEGAFDAMGSGEVDENWAKEHHSLWAREMADKKAKATAPEPPKAAPAPAE